MYSPNNLLKENTDYIFLPSPNDEQQYSIGIRSGIYSGTDFEFKTIKIREQNDIAKIEFTYDILSHEVLEVIDDIKDFEKHIGLILHSIFSDIYESDNPEEQMRIDETNRKNHSSKLNS